MKYAPQIFVSNFKNWSIFCKFTCKIAPHFKNVQHPSRPKLEGLAKSARFGSLEQPIRETVKGSGSDQENKPQIRLITPIGYKKKKSKCRFSTYKSSVTELEGSSSSELNDDSFSIDCENQNCSDYEIEDIESIDLGNDDNSDEEDEHLFYFKNEQEADDNIVEDQERYNAIQSATAVLLAPTFFCTQGFFGMGRDNLIEDGESYGLDNINSGNYLAPVSTMSSSIELYTPAVDGNMNLTNTFCSSDADDEEDSDDASESVEMIYFSSDE